MPERKLNSWFIGKSVAWHTIILPPYIGIWNLVDLKFDELNEYVSEILKGGKEIQYMNREY